MPKNDLGNMIARRIDFLKELEKESWKAAHVEAMKACDADDTVAEATSRSELFQAIFKQIGLLVDGNAKLNVCELADHLHDLYVATADKCQEARELALKSMSDGYCVSGMEALEVAIDELESLYAESLSKWPTSKSELIQRSLADLDAGRFQTCEEILNEFSNEGSGVG